MTCNSLYSMFIIDNFQLKIIRFGKHIKSVARINDVFILTWSIEPQIDLDCHEQLVPDKICFGYLLHST